MYLVNLSLKQQTESFFFFIYWFSNAHLKDLLNLNLTFGNALKIVKNKLVDKVIVSDVIYLLQILKDDQTRNQKKC